MKKLSLVLCVLTAFTVGCDGKNPKSTPSDEESGKGSQVNPSPKAPGVDPQAPKEPPKPVVNQPVKPDPPKKFPTFKELEDAGIIRKLDRTDTLAGVDADNDGIRDDIELYIEELQVTDKQKSALRFEAYTLQKALLVDLNDKDALSELDKEASRSVVCMDNSFPDLNENIKYSRTLEAYTMNTRKRTERYIQYNMAFSGTTLGGLPEGDTCEIH